DLGVRDVSFKRTMLPFLMMILLSVSCSRPRTMTADDLRSEIVSAISLASETQMFIQQMQNDRGTRPFDVGHLDYLRGEAVRSAKEVHDAQPDSGIGQKVNTCRGQLDLLARELTGLQSETNDRRALPASNNRVAEIQRSLEGLQAEL